MRRSIFHYRPQDGYFGDTVPFFWQGQYHLFYLKGQSDPWRRVKYTPYCHLVSIDLVHWQELPIALELGSIDEIDMSLGTGTIIEKDGTFNLLYCGRVFQGDRSSGNPHWEKSAIETVCLATSKDLITWVKDSRNPILVPDDRLYELSDFRDPFPFWNEEEKCYWMLIAGKQKGVPLPGTLALAVSLDLEHWELKPPFLAPNLTPMAPECPDLFQSGNFWYLYYSCDRHTVYRYAHQLSGPWLRPFSDPRDHWNIYAPKTLFDGKRRFLMGWIATKTNEQDNGSIEWGGDSLIPRQLEALPDGRLAESCPIEIIAACSENVPYQIQPCVGHWQIDDNHAVASRTDGLAYTKIKGIPDHFLLDMTLACNQIVSASCAAGVMFRASNDLQTHYALRLEFDRKRVVVERFPHSSETAFLVERPLTAELGQPVHIQLFVDGDILEGFINDEYALACRLYDFVDGDVGLFCEFSQTLYSNITIKALPMH